MGVAGSKNGFIGENETGMKTGNSYGVVVRMILYFQLISAYCLKRNSWLFQISDSNQRLSNERAGFVVHVII